MRALATLALVLLAACPAGRNPECAQVCEREARCSNQLADNGPFEDYRIDEGECIAACAVLLRDDEAGAHVRAHMACVEKAESCAEIAACK